MLPVTILTIAVCILVGGAVADTPDDVVPPGDEGAEGRIPSREELLAMLDSMSGLSDEEKDNLRQQLSSDGTAEQLPTGNGQMQQFLMLFAFLGLIALIFIFIGYKLYKSLTERERQRMEKKRLKESKRKTK